MEARASFPEARIPTGVALLFLASLLAALLLGGVGGYVVRGWSSSSSTTTSTTHHPFVVESPPYTVPSPSPAQSPTLDPGGNVIPI